VLAAESCTGSGNLRKSRFDEPTQSSGLSPFANRARMINIPDLGWSRKTRGSALIPLLRSCFVLAQVQVEIKIGFKIAKSP
jgi:hypothetical protein